MATVPRISPGVENRAAPFVPQSAAGATLDNFGGGNAQAAIRAGADLARAGDVAAQLANAQQQEDNEREAKRLDVAFSEQLRTLTHGDGSEANPGLYGQRGENALAAAPKTQKAIEEARRKLMGTTQNARVQEMFGDISARRQEQEFGQIARFTTREREVANDATSEARATSAAADAAANWKDPKAVSTAMAVINGEIADMGRRKGWAPEVTQLQLQTARTKAVTGMIQAAVREDPLQAEALYNENKATLLGTARAGIETMLEQQTMAARSQKASDEILARVGNNETAALAAAKEITHAKLRDETTARLVAEYNRRQGVEANARARVNFAQGQESYRRAQTERQAERASIELTDNIIATTTGWEARHEAAKKLPHELRLAVEKRLKSEQVRLEGVRNADVQTAGWALSDEAEKKFPNDRSAQYKFIGESADGKLRTQALQNLDTTFRRDESVRQEELREAKREGFRAATTGEGLAAWQQANPEKMALISGDGNTVQNLVLADSRRQLNERHAPVSEEGLIDKFRKAPAIELSRVDMNEFMHRLSVKDFDELSKLSAQAKKRIEGLDSDKTSNVRMEKLLDDMAPDLFRPKAGLSEERKRAVADRQNAVRNELGVKIDAFKTENGKNPPDETLRRWVTEALIPIESSNYTTWFGHFFTPRYAAEIGRLTAAQRETVQVPLDKVDPRVKEQMDAALARTGPVTDDRRRKFLRATILSQNTSIPMAEREKYRREALTYTTPKDR